jgi:long-chain fatty acid transport protein
VRRHDQSVRTSPVIAALVLAFCGTSAPARAQGFGLYEQGTCAMGRAGAGVASPCDDGSSVFFNPAGLALDPKTVVSAEITGVAPRGTFTDSTTGQVSSLNNRTFPVPTAYFATPMGSRAVVGIGVFAPYGLTTDWPTTSEGRFLGYYSSVKSIYVQPTVAVRLSDRVSVGAGLDVTRTSLELKKRVDLATLAIPGAGGLTFSALGVAKGTDFADVDLTGSGTQVGGHFGVIIKANDRLSLGARYLVRQRVSATNGQVATTQIVTNRVLPAALSPSLPAGTPIDLLVASAFNAGGLLSAQTATTSLPLPDQLVLGVAVKASKNLTLMGDYQYTHWSLFDNLTITNQFAPTTILVESYRDTHGIRIGADYSFGRAVLRAGFDGHTASAPDQTVTPLLPEGSRKELAGGVSVRLKPNFGVEVAYMYLSQGDRSGRTTDGGLAVPTTAVNNGTYRYHGNLFSGGIVIHF